MVVRGSLRFLVFGMTDEKKTGLEDVQMATFGKL